VARTSSWIKQARSKSGLTQQQLADKLGVSQPQVSFWETGALGPSADTLARISDITRVPYEEEKVPSDFATWLKTLREKSGLTRQQLTEKSGMSYLTLYFIETGKTQSPQKATIDALTQVLGPPPNETVESVRREETIGDLGSFRGPFPIDKWEENVGDSPMRVRILRQPDEAGSNRRD
jgi:transcriptional regulator with XRE-family HTH domain